MYTVIASKENKDIKIAEYSEKRKAEDFKHAIQGSMMLSLWIVWVKEER